MSRILVAGVGNIFLGDDGFGVEVVRRLDGETFPTGVHVADYGIRGVHLAYQLLEGYDLLILIDAATRGLPPGTVFILEPDFDDNEALERRESGFLVDAHSLDPEMVLGILRDLGGHVGRVVIVGCEPADISERMGLSQPVARAIDEAAATVRRLIDAEVDHSPAEWDDVGAMSEMREEDKR